MSAAPCNCPDYKCRCDLSIQSKCLECRTPKNPRDLIYCRCLFPLCAPCYEKLYPGHDSTGPCVACDCDLELHPVVHYLQVQLRRAEYVLTLAGQPSDLEEEQQQQGGERSDRSDMSDAEDETNPASVATVEPAVPAAAPEVPSFLPPAVAAAPLPPPPSASPAAHTTNVIPPFVFVVPAFAPPVSTKRPLESSPESFGRLYKRRVIDLD